MSTYVISCHLMSSYVIVCHLMSSYVILCQIMSSYVILCHLMSSYVILKGSARLSNFLETHLLTYLHSRFLEGPSPLKILILRKWYRKDIINHKLINFTRAASTALSRTALCPEQHFVKISTHDPTWRGNLKGCCKKSSTFTRFLYHGSIIFIWYKYELIKGNEMNE
jgi:hypothetical protein